MTVEFLNILFVLLIIAAFVFLAGYEKKITFKTKKILLLTAIILLSILAGVREIGTDLSSYSNIFYNRYEIINDYVYFIQNVFTYKFEPAFMVLISLIKQFGLGLRFLLFISALLPMLLLYKLIIKVDRELSLTIFLFFLLTYVIRGPLDIIRHFFAAIIYLSALYSLSKNSNTFYFAKSGMSILFHYSNITTMFIRPFLTFKWNISKYLISLVVMHLIGYGLQGILINNIVNIGFESSMFQKFRNYLINDYTYNNNIHFIFRNLLENFLPFFNILLSLVALNYKKIMYGDKFNGIILNSMIIGTLFYSLFYGMGAYTMAFRFNFLYGIGSFFILKELFVKRFENNRSILFGLIVTFLLFYNFIVAVYYLGIYKFL